MSNKTTLQSNNALISQNNTDLQALIDTANALPEAGSGGSGGSSVTQGTFTVVDNGMDEPGVNEYALSANNLNSSARNCIVVYTIAGSLKRANFILFRANTNESFVATPTSHYITAERFVLEENTIYVYGNLSDSHITSVEFLAY